MKTLIPSISLFAALALTSAEGSLIITGVIDGDLSGGLPKAIVLTATTAVADLSTFGIGSANNGGGTDGEEFTFSGSADSGATILVVDSGTSSDFFTNNYSDSFIIFTTGAASINGDDAVELFGSSLVIDTYGDPNTNGDGETWDYTDGYAVRTGGSAGAFDQANYNSQFRGLDTLDEAQHASTLAGVFGFTPVPETTTALLGALGLLGLLRRRR